MYMLNWRRRVKSGGVCSCYWSSLTDKLLNCCTNNPPACTWTYSSTTDCRLSWAALFHNNKWKTNWAPGDSQLLLLLWPSKGFLKIFFKKWSIHGERQAGPVCLPPAPTGICSGARRQVKLSELSAVTVLIFSFRVDSCFNDSCCSCCLSRCQTVSLALCMFMKPRTWLR